MAAEHPQDYWHHGEAAGPWEGGFKFIVGFEGKIHGEFEVEKSDPRIQDGAIATPLSQEPSIITIRPGLTRN